MLTGVIYLPDQLFHRPDPLFECFDVAVNAGKDHSFGGHQGRAPELTL